MPRDLLPGPLSFKRTGPASEHRLTIETKPGRAYAGKPNLITSRWYCSCGAGGPWITERNHATAVNAAADYHRAHAECSPSCVECYERLDNGAFALREATQKRLRAEISQGAKNPTPAQAEASGETP